MSVPIRVAVVESHPATREGIVTALNLNGRFDVVVSVPDAQALVASEVSAEVCLLDLEVDGSRESALQVVGRQPTVVWTDREDWRFRTAAFLLGVWSVLPRGKVHPSSIEEALLHASRREVHLSPQLASALLDAATRGVFELTATQLGLLREISYGTRLSLAVERARLTPDGFLAERDGIVAACRSADPEELGPLHIVPMAPIREPRFVGSPTKRHLDVLSRLADGHRVKDIAAEFGISVRTVAHHIDNGLKEVSGVTHASAHERLLLALYYMRRHRSPEVLWETRLRGLVEPDQRVHPGVGKNT
ncbi:LuxR C-terminal-related transcriptional regulator [Streptosporangium carneum]|uniref:HTH luxR-type domain-containing protein n=1 Tax=Streptosporangium carneum TaxID=47481 RepID=A0A9W6HX37_9ACTN|nr:LuxR C-terminal-related transcriptional regulator [Streptosporangium carneum]GLK07010.1 hypothetical protein GCM10017600_04150 [Streptosporangium carneum]